MPRWKAPSRQGLSGLQQGYGDQGLNAKIGTLTTRAIADGRSVALFPIDHTFWCAGTAATTEGPSRIFFADLGHSDDARSEIDAKHWRYVPRLVHTLPACRHAGDHCSGVRQDGRGIGLAMALETISWLGYVVLHCRDLEAARSFYCHVMGLPIAYERADWIQFRVGDSGLVLRPLDGGLGDRRAKRAAVQLGIRVRYDEINACYEELKARGVEVLETPSDQGWGHRTLFFADPEGNLLEMYADLPGERGG